MHHCIRALIFISILLMVVGCSNPTSVKNSDDSHEHDSHEHHSDATLNTKDQQEIMQQEINSNLNKWYSKNIFGDNIKIAILDTGIDKDNSDLSYIKGANFTSENIEAFDDDNGHGTKIAGIIGARKNSYNLLGIAPKSDLYIAKVANENGDVKFEDLIKGVYWAIEQNVDIINISLEFPNENHELHEAIKLASKNNIIVIASSGNIKYEGDTDNSYPGEYPEVISVGMLNTEGKVYSEEFKKKKVDVLAPGQDIFSLYLNDKMTIDTGVSFATAYTSGYCALIMHNYKVSDINYDKQKIVSQLKKDLEQNL